MFLWFYTLPLTTTVRFFVAALLIWYGVLLLLKTHRTKTKGLCAALLFLWLCGFLYVTLFSRSAGEHAHSLIPFAHLYDLLTGGSKELFRTDWMNFLLFVPFGLCVSPLLPRCLDLKRHVLFALALALLLSAAVELVQWCADLGRAEMDDVLTNVVGTLPGVMVFWQSERALRRIGA